MEIQRPVARVIDTTLVMAIAAILVTNSHLEAFYPRRWMAGDGLIGNSLFFMLAGYGLVRSDRFSHRAFIAWLWRRIVRIHPTLWITVIVFGLLLGQEWRYWSPGQYVNALIWPTRFTFVQLVFPFYLVFYWLMNLRRSWVYPMGICVLILPYCIGYIPDALNMPAGSPLQLGNRPMLVHVSAYFQVMLLGGWLAWHDSPMLRSLRLSTTSLLVVSVTYLLAKLAMVLGHAAQWYFALHALTLAFCFFAFESLTARTLTDQARRILPLSLVATFVGGLTLEIYMVHEFVAQYRWLWSLRFPENLLAFWALILPLAAVTGRASRLVQSSLRGERRSQNPGSDLTGTARQNLEVSAVNPNELVPSTSPRE